MENIPRHSQEEISGHVLAGGLSSRLGLDKVLLPWRGQTLLEHSIERLRQVCATVRVCTDRKDLEAYLPESESLVRDALAGAGPLTGIVAGLEHSETPWNFFLAVDLPLVPMELLQALAMRAGSSHVAGAGTLCILPQLDGLPQPLCGLYHRTLMDPLRIALRRGKYKIMLALRDAMLNLENGAAFEPGTPASGIELFDAQAFAAMAVPNSTIPPNDWFLNINTPEEWQRANEFISM